MLTQTNLQDKMFEKLFGSKKFVAALGTFLAAALAELGLDMDPQTILTVLSPLMAYVVGQGIADHGKEKAKVEAEAKKANPEPSPTP